MVEFFLFMLFACMTFMVFMLCFILVDLLFEQRLSRKIGKWFDRKFGA